MKRAITLLVTVAIAIGVMAGPASAGTVYEVTHGWSVKNAKGQVMMSPYLRIRWKAGAVVNGIVEKDCWDGPGYASFKGCEITHGKPGYPSMGIGVTWHYVLGFDPVGLVIHYYCDWRGSIWENGGFNGTITCDYGSGKGGAHMSALRITLLTFGAILGAFAVMAWTLNVVVPWLR